MDMMREIEIERKDREPEERPTQVQISVATGSVPPTPPTYGGNDRNLELGGDLADIIYVFIPSKEMGFKFYSRSPRSALRTGVFETEPSSISTVEWDENINSKKGPTTLELIDGEVTVMTYIVSEEIYVKLMDYILSKQEKDRIVIDLGLTNEAYNNIDDKQELINIKDTLLNNVKENNFYSNIDDKDEVPGFWDEYNNINKKL